MTSEVSFEMMAIKQEVATFLPHSGVTPKVMYVALSTFVQKFKAAWRAIDDEPACILGSAMAF